MSFKRDNHLFNNFPGRLSIIPTKIDECDESSLDASTVPTYEEFSSKSLSKIAPYLKNDPVLYQAES